MFCSGCRADGRACAEKDQLAYDAISALHRQIDDDHDGDVDLTESDEVSRDVSVYYRPLNGSTSAGGSKLKPLRLGNPFFLVFIRQFRL